MTSTDPAVPSKKPAPRKVNPATLQRVRQLHLWLGTLFAPMIVFFALTGAVQTFGLHEKPGTPAWVVKLSQIHKNQTLVVHERPQGPQPGAAKPGSPTHRQVGGSDEGGPPANGATASRAPSPLPLKIFVVLMAFGLTFTTLLGVWMAFKYSRDKRIVWALLAAGTLLPLAMLLY